MLYLFKRRLTVWTKNADDRALLRDLARAVVAVTAVEDLDDFDMLIDRYFASPIPKIPIPLHRDPAADAQPPPRVAEVAPAVVSVLLTLLVFKIQEAVPTDQIDVVRAALRGRLRLRRNRFNSGMRVKPATATLPQRLSILVYIYTLPVQITIPISELISTAETTGRVYRLDEEQAAILAHAAVSRLCASASA